MKTHFICQTRENNKMISNVTLFRPSINLIQHMPLTYYEVEDKLLVQKNNW